MDWLKNLLAVPASLADIRRQINVLIARTDRMATKEDLRALIADIKVTAGQEAQQVVAKVAAAIAEAVAPLELLVQQLQAQIAELENGQDLQDIADELLSVKEAVAAIVEDVTVDPEPEPEPVDPTEPTF